MLLHGQVVGQNCRGQPRTVWNSLILTRLNHYIHNAQNKPGADLRCMHLITVGQARVSIVVAAAAAAAAAAVVVVVVVINTIVVGIVINTIGIVMISVI